MQASAECDAQSTESTKYTARKVQGTTRAVRGDANMSACSGTSRPPPFEVVEGLQGLGKSEEFENIGNFPDLELL